MNLTLEQAIGQQMLVAFTGRDPSPGILAQLARQHLGGVTLFRPLNVDNPAQVRRLTAALQAAAQAAGQPPLLICVDQEGGTLQALAGLTPFPGNMALGATNSPDLARQVGLALGRELAAVGVNVNYAPVCDVQNNPQNPVVGVRSFGGDPALVARLGAALIEGLQAAGVAATAKHFPGHGDTATDSHYGTPVLPHDAARLRQMELPPFAAAIAAGVRLVMTAHIALPALNNGQNMPATLSPAILRGLLRDELGFGGVIISDAMDMGAIAQGVGLGGDSVAAVAAGVDLLLLTDNAESHQIVYDALCEAAQSGRLPADTIQAAAGRILALKTWLAGQEQPALDVIGCAEHQALAHTVAARAQTLVRDTAGRLPLRLTPERRIAAVVPRPADLTPADTSSYEFPALAPALRRYHPLVDEIAITLDPAADEIAALRTRLQGYDLVVIGTINAPQHPGQAALVTALLDAGQAVIAVALRLPYDILAYPTVPTYLCTYSLLPPSMAALAEGLWGHLPFPGQLPVPVPGF